jgi:hypothetical protein
MFVKVIKGMKMVSTVEDAIDDKYVRKDMIEYGRDGRPHLQNKFRARPYLADSYDSYWCELAKSDPFDHPEDCPDCKPYDDYWSGFDLGFLCGSINKIVVVDIDPRNIQGFVDIEDFLVKIETTYGPLPKTWRVESPSGGIHLYYKWPYPFKSNKGGWISGIDFLGENSWVKFPPATKETGSYFWSIPPTLENIGELPDWIPRMHLRKVPEKPIVKMEFPKHKKDDPSERVKVMVALDKLNAHDLNHGERSTLAYCLFHNGYENEFNSWADSHGWEVKASQVRAWGKAHTAKSIGYLFNLVKEYSS